MTRQLKQEEAATPAAAASTCRCCCSSCCSSCKAAAAKAAAAKSKYNLCIKARFIPGFYVMKSDDTEVLEYHDYSILFNEYLRIDSLTLTRRFDDSLY